MKNNQQKATNLPLIGKDELNLTECPFTLLTDKAAEGQKTLKFTDRQNDIIRHWIITGSDEYGLPCAVDEEIYTGMLVLSKRAGFNDRTIYFNPYELLKLMQWPTSGHQYKRLELALSRLSGVTIYADYFWNKGEFRRGKFIFHIIDEAFIDKGKKNSQGSYFVWSRVIFESFLSGNLKNLNLDIYFDLKTPISKRFFRLWDKRLYKTDQTSFNLQELAHEKLGISRNFIYPSSLKQKLEPTLKEHKAKGLLASAIYTKGKNGDWLLNIRRCKADPEPLPEENPPLPEKSLPEPQEDPFLEKLLLLKIPTNKAKILLQTYFRELIEGWIMALDLVKPKPRNRAGYLLKALEEKWELPEEVRKKRAEEEREREKKLQAAYDEYVLAQVDEYLKTMDPRQVEEEIAEHKEVYFSKLPPHFKEDLWESEGMKPRIRADYMRDKAKVIGVISFEEWKTSNKNTVES